MSRTTGFWNAPGTPVRRSSFTGDRHLLSIASFEGIRIVTLSDFLEQERVATPFPVP
jgi:hypothetical protein